MKGWLQYCCDGCTRCRCLVNLPIRQIKKDSDGVRLEYKCRWCRHVWSTWWSMPFARGHAEACVQELIEGGLRDYDRMVAGLVERREGAA